MNDCHMSIHIFVLLIFTCYSCDDYLFVLFYINFTPPNCSFEIYAYFLLFTFLNKLFRLKKVMFIVDLGVPEHNVAKKKITDGSRSCGRAESVMDSHTTVTFHTNG